MAEEIAVQAESAASPPAVEAQPDLKIPTDSEGYNRWRLTGELPGDKPKADSTPADSEKEAAPEAEKTAEKMPAKRAGADERLREILADLKQAGLTPSELKTFRKAQREEAAQTPEPHPVQASPPPSVPTKGPEAPAKPKYADFNDWEKYEAAKDKYTEDLTEYKTQQAISKYQQEQAQRESQQRWSQKLAEASQRYGAESESTIVSTARTISEDQQIHPAVKAVLDDSPVLTDLLYVMGGNAEALEEFTALARTNPGLAIRKAVLLERLVSDELNKQQQAAPAVERGEDGKFQAAAPAKKVSQAPPPPREVAGHAGPPPDESESAVKNNNFRAFREAENRKQLARLKGQ